MKKILGILFLCLISFDISLANDFHWILNQTEFKNPNKLTFGDDKKRFQNFLEKNIPNKRSPIEFGDDRFPIVEDLIGSFSHPLGSIKKIENRYLVVESCMHKYCRFKGLAFIDSNKKEVIGAMLLQTDKPRAEGQDLDKIEIQLIFSKMYENYNRLPKIFLDVIKNWKKENNLEDKPLVSKFLGTDNLYKNISLN